MFSVNFTEGEARCGVLTTTGGSINTPALLVYTHRGGAVNLTVDLLEKLKPELQALQLDVLQFLTQPKPEVLRQHPGGSGRQFLALDAGYVLVATARDPALYEYAGSMRKSTDNGALVTVHTGSATVTPAQFMEAVAALAPHIWVALSDDIPSDSRSDRAAKAVDRTVAWLRACLAAATGVPALAGALAFAAVQGGQHLSERIRCAEAVAAQPGVAGYVLAGLGTGESPELRQRIVEAVLQKLPSGAPRMLCSVGTPEEVLDAVAQGIDLFDMGYLSDVTNGGYALTFPLSPEAEQQAAQQAAQQAQQQERQPAAASGGVAGEGAASAPAPAVELEPAAAVADSAADRGQDDSKLNLWALACRLDRRPLLPGCGCFACGSHTRAYIHHLLQTHEMTAQVLLEAHNTHHYLQFFEAVRSSVAAGGFAAYRAWFLARRQRWLVGQQEQGEQL